MRARDKMRDSGIIIPLRHRTTQHSAQRPNQRRASERKQAAVLAFMQTGMNHYVLNKSMAFSRPDEIRGLEFCRTKCDIVAKEAAVMRRKYTHTQVGHILT